jgi:hypothetical protein
VSVSSPADFAVGGHRPGLCGAFCATSNIPYENATLSISFCTQSRNSLHGQASEPEFHRKRLEKYGSLTKRGVGFVRGLKRPVWNGKACLRRRTPACADLATSDRGFNPVSKENPFIKEPENI